MGAALSRANDMVGLPTAVGLWAAAGLALLWGAGAAYAGPRLDQEATARATAIYSKNPNDPDLFPNTYESNEQLVARESLKAQWSRGVRVEFNAYAMITNSSDKTSLAQSLLTISDESNRSSSLERHWYNSNKADGYLTLDRLNIRGKIAGTEVTAGRFPINMTVMGVFTPNDFFAPYRPFDYYREYKPGVDALRFDHALGKKGQISVIGVAGYDNPPLISRLGTQTEASGRFSLGRSSGLVRTAYTWRGVETAAFAGKAADADIVGGSLQGEWRAIGMRAEVNQKLIRDATSRKQAEAAVGLDFRLTGKIIVTGEQFYNGSGYKNAAGYEHIQENPTPTSLLLGANYSALALLYDITPLAHLKSLLLYNDGDQSYLASFQFSYSLTERAEVGLAVLSPHGKGPEQLLLKSEFGTYPSFISFQAGVYF